MVTVNRGESKEFVAEPLKLDGSPGQFPVNRFCQWSISPFGVLNIELFSGPNNDVLKAKADVLGTATVSCQCDGVLSQAFEVTVVEGSTPPAPVPPVPSFQRINIRMRNPGSP